MLLQTHISEIFFSISILVSVAEGLHSRASSADIGEAVWGTINGSTTLQWTPCYSTFQCAKFQVPLNYSDPAGPPATIAIVRKQANVTDPAAYRGPILFNPGGPGGSGVDLVLQSADQFATIIGPEFDLVGFDPRGVSRTHPQVTWFESDIEAALWQAGVGNTARTTLDDYAHLWARSQIIGRIAEERNYDAIAHVRTENVVTDMLKITEAFGYGNLQFWGFSYGTILGITFASLYPDKVGKVILDGVVDVYDYYSGADVSSLRDTDKTLQVFFDQCAASSPQECAFYSPTASEIKARLDKLYDSIKSEPIPVQTTSGYGYDYVDFSTLRTVVFYSLYSPQFAYPLLAVALKELEQGNGTSIISLVNIVRGNATKLECKCGQPAKTVIPSDEAGIAISCGDSQVMPEKTPAALYQKYLMSVKNYSSFEDFWSVWSAECSGWRFRAPERFLGPFGAKSTSNPILFIGNTADPVTPLMSARSMSSLFPGSEVLVQNTSGHTSTAVSSLCTANNVRAFFVNGTLPANGTVCQPDAPIFKPSNQVSLVRDEAVAARSLEDRELLDAIKSLSLKNVVTRLRLSI